MKKTQIGWVTIIIVALVEIISILQHANSTSFMIITAAMIFVLLFFGTLTIKVSATHIRFYFGIGLIRGKYHLSDVIYCRPTEYFTLGWGIRFKPGLTIFCVSGNKAIEIRRKSSYQIIYIGTDNPEIVAKWVNEMKAKIQAI